MNKDISFCANTIGCPYKYTCLRNLNNYKISDEEKLKATMCEFEHSNTKCEFYKGIE